MIDLERLAYLIDRGFWRKRYVFAEHIFMDNTGLGNRLHGRVPWKADDLLLAFKELHLTKEEAESVIFPDSYQKEMGWKHD